MVKKFPIAFFLLAIAIALQAMGYAVSRPIGDAALLLGFALVVLASWILGSLFRREKLLLAIGSAILLAGIYWRLDLAFLDWYRVDFLHTFLEEQQRNFTMYFAIFLLPLLIVSSAAAGFATKRQS